MPSAASLMVSVTAAAAITASTPPSSAATQRSTRSASTSGRAASWTTTTSASPAAASALRTHCERAPPRRRARAAPRHEHVLTRPLDPRRHGDDDALDRRGRLQRGERPLEHWPARQHDERLGAGGTKAFATSGGHKQGDRQRNSLGAAYLVAAAAMPFCSAESESRS